MIIRIGRLEDWKIGRLQHYTMMGMRGLPVVVALLLAGACASSPARSSVTVPLEIPEPPPRVAMDPGSGRRRRGRLSCPSGHPSTPAEKAAAPKTPPATTAAAAPPPAVTDRPGHRRRSRRAPTPPPELRPAGSGRQTPTAAQVRDRLVRTKQKLDSDSAAQLNAGKRTDYDSARRFLSQAEAAVKDNNLLLAESSVEKAETLAEGLNESYIGRFDAETRRSQRILREDESLCDSAISAICNSIYFIGTRTDSFCDICHRSARVLRVDLERPRAIGLAFPRRHVHEAPEHRRLAVDAHSGVARLHRLVVRRPAEDAGDVLAPSSASVRRRACTRDRRRDTSAAAPCPA